MQERSENIHSHYCHLGNEYSRHAPRELAMQGLMIHVFIPNNAPTLPPAAAHHILLIPL